MNDQNNSRVFQNLVGKCEVCGSDKLVLKHEFACDGYCAECKFPADSPGGENLLEDGVPVARLWAAEQGIWTEEEIQALEEACNRADASDLRAFGLTEEEEEEFYQDLMDRYEE